MLAVCHSPPVLGSASQQSADWLREATGSPPLAWPVATTTPIAGLESPPVTKRPWSWALHTPAAHLQGASEQKREGFPPRTTPNPHPTGQHRPPDGTLHWPRCGAQLTSRQPGGLATCSLLPAGQRLSRRATRRAQAGRLGTTQPVASRQVPTGRWTRRRRIRHQSHTRQCTATTAPTLITARLRITFSVSAASASRTVAVSQPETSSALGCCKPELGGWRNQPPANTTANGNSPSSQNCLVWSTRRSRHQDRER